MRPGDDAGDCPRCGDTRTCIGRGEAVIGTWCERCDLVTVLQGTALTVHEERERRDEWEPDEWESRGAPVGPDPNP